MISRQKICRACGSSRLTQILDLGNTALANDFLEPHEVRDYSRFFPLRLLLCPDCSLAQLADVVDAKVLYSRYAYVTSTSRTMDEHLAQLRDDLLAAGGFDSNAARLKVLEFGSNTGNLLKRFQTRGCAVLGVEPAANISVLADREGVPTRTDFFCERSAREIASTWGKADLIVGRHVFAHIDDWHGMVRAFHALTSEHSVVALEVPYLVDFFEGVQFDTMYHEHLSYVSARAMQALLADSPLELQHLLHYHVHGGSIVFLLRHRSTAPVHPSVREGLIREEKIGLSHADRWRDFSDRVDHVRSALPALIRGFRSQGKHVIGYGASAKGNTLLNCCGLTAGDLDYIIDNTPFKQNKLAPGSWIPVRPPEMLLANQPDFALLLAWSYAKEIIAREEEYQRRGGRFIIPIPTPRVVEFGA